MITKEELEELNWKHEDHWYSYPIKHTSHSNEYFDENGNLIYFPYYSLHHDSRPNLNKFWIQDPDGSTIFTGRIESKEDMKAIMRSLIDYTYQKEE